MSFLADQHKLRHTPQENYPKHNSYEKDGRQGVRLDESRSVVIVVKFRSPPNIVTSLGNVCDLIQDVMLCNWAMRDSSLCVSSFSGPSSQRIAIATPSTMSEMFSWLIECAIAYASWTTKARPFPKPVHPVEWSCNCYTYSPVLPRTGQLEVF